MATAVRLGSRVDAGLLAGCVVLSLIAVALPAKDREPIAGALRRSIVAPLVGTAIEDAGIDSPLNALHCVAAVGAGVEPPGFSLVGPLPPHPLMQKVKASAHPSDLLIIFVS